MSVVVRHTRHGERGSSAIKHIIEEQPSRPDHLHGRLRHTVHYVDPHDLVGKHVLNVGCGFGWFELYAVAVGVQQITGIELTPQDLRAARKYAQCPNTTFIAASGLALPFADQHFHTVCSWEVLEHLPRQSEQKFFQEVRRVLKPGGSFYLSTPHCSRFYTAADPAWWLIGHRHYQTGDIRSYAAHSSFDVADLMVAGGFVEVASLWNLYISKWVFHSRPFLGDSMDRLTDKDFDRGNGFTNIFCKLLAT